MSRLHLHFIVFIALFGIAGCNSEGDDDDDLTTGTVEVRFENIVGTGTNLSLAATGSTNYPFTNVLGQEFNVTVLKYLISEIVLEGPNGEHYEDELLVTSDHIHGYYLVNQAEVSSQVIALHDVPAGTYNKIIFKVGVEAYAIQEGTAGGVLTQEEGGMFWSWNAGYQALRIEGHSPANETGVALGESLSDTDKYGFAYHVGGWSEPNNNQAISLDIDDLEVNNQEAPEIHLVMDVLELLSNPTQLNFSTTFNIHSPAAGEALANNIPQAFKFDHIHQ